MDTLFSIFRDCYTRKYRRDNDYFELLMLFWLMDFGLIFGDD